MMMSALPCYIKKRKKRRVIKKGGKRKKEYIYKKIELKIDKRLIKKEREKMIYEKRRKRRRERRSRLAPHGHHKTPKCRLTPSRILLFYTFVVYHQGPCSTYTNCVCGLALVLT